MPLATPVRPEVFTISEVAQAAEVPVADVRALMDAAGGRDHGRYLSFEEAVRLVRRIRLRAARRRQRRQLFEPLTASERHRGVPMAASGALHAGALSMMILLAGLGVRSAPTEATDLDPVRLVFLMTPGPGGGGGGGGLRQPSPPPQAQLRGDRPLRSPVTVAKAAERPEPVARQETPPPALPEPKPDPPLPAAQPEPTPPVTAPVVSVPSDAADRAGVLADTASQRPNNGPGSGGGTGTGQGTGSGEGNGAGIGDGSIAGYGGGPYRPGSGITPPGLLKEVKPVYSEEGRRRGVEGDVLLEVVVRADGTVGSVRVVRGLGAGLDQRAAEAVRQWRFSPARRFGTPVDVLVEVAVEFRLR
jgi:protein TonB